ncbi:hypothetical protein HZA99_01325, partial [Candidatus Woesearchaeota archaeon]|nr:hypothetical protein [Candidatus Woesearchaeota archaeon]
MADAVEVTETTAYDDLFERVQTRYFRPKYVRDCLLALRDAVEAKWYSKPVREFIRKWYFKQAPSAGVMDALREVRAVQNCSLENVIDATYNLNSKRPSPNQASNMEAAVVFAHEIGGYRFNHRIEIPSQDTAAQEELAVALALMETANTYKIDKKMVIPQIVFMVHAPKRYKSAREMLDARGKLDQVRHVLQTIRERADELTPRDKADEPNPFPKSIIHVYPALDYLEGRVLLQEGKLAEAQHKFETALAAPENDYSPLFGVKRDDVVVGLAMVYYNKKDFAALQDIFNKNISSSQLWAYKQEVALNLCTRGKQSQAKGNFVDARNYYRRVLEFDPRHLKATLKIAESYKAQTGREVDARSWYRKVIALDARHLPAHLGMA